MRNGVAEAIVLRNDRIYGRPESGEQVYRMTLQLPEGSRPARAGQFVNIYPSGRDTLLPRPISVCRSNGAVLTIVYRVAGSGTGELACRVMGDAVKTSPPLGNGYDLDVFSGLEKPTALLCGGGIGVPPLYELACGLLERGIGVTAVLGFRHAPFLVRPFLQVGAKVFTATDSGTAGFHGSVLELINKMALRADRYFACGPRPMLRAFAGHCLAKGADAQISVEERMGCGYGACVGCAVETRTGMKRVCRDGPVFYGSEIIWRESALPN